MYYSPIYLFNNHLSIRYLMVYILIIFAQPMLSDKIIWNGVEWMLFY